MYLSITVIGRLGRAPELRYLPNGDPVTSFSIATDRQYNDRSGQKVKETTWFRVSVFGKQAESANTYLDKGKLVLVEGRLRCDPKTGGPVLYQKQDGTVASNFEIVASTVRFLSPRNEGAGGESTEDFVGDAPSGDPPSGEAPPSKPANNDVIDPRNRKPASHTPNVDDNDDIPF